MTPPPDTPPGETPPGTTPPGTTPPGETPPGTTPPGGNDGPGETPPPTVDPVLVFLMTAFEATRELVAAEFPGAPPEFQEWVTGLVFNYFFGDLLFEYLFGSPSDSGFGFRRR
jgi:hypothetical protein